MDANDTFAAGSIVTLAVGSSLLLTVPTATAIELAQAADSDAVRMLRQAVLNVPSSIRMTFVDSQGSVVVAQFDNTFEKFNNNFDKAVV